MIEIVIATRNRGKLRELAQLLSDLPLKLLSADKAGVPDIEETGRTFEENAVQKALTAARASGKPAIGEDSGLEVDALDGKPGVFSSRFAGPNATDEERNQLILTSLTGVPFPQRTARYHAVMALATPEGLVGVSHGICEGFIAEQPAGTNGFGYDPIFYYPPFGCTMGQASPEAKNRVSHRSRALAGLLPMLRRLLEQMR
ncbi:MAG: XTP/dITP diphosphatase [Armatimonadota bacterium]